MDDGCDSDRAVCRVGKWVIGGDMHGLMREVRTFAIGCCKWISGAAGCALG